MAVPSAHHLLCYLSACSSNEVQGRESGAWAILMDSASLDSRGPTKSQTRSRRKICAGAKADWVGRHERQGSVRSLLTQAPAIGCGEKSKKEGRGKWAGLEGCFQRTLGMRASYPPPSSSACPLSYLPSQAIFNPLESNGEMAQ